MLPLEITIPLTVSEDVDISLGVTEQQEQITLTVTEGGGSEYPYYVGETTVIPKVREDVELQTAQKALLENIVVKEIPYYETSNVKGKTFIIGG